MFGMDDTGDGQVVNSQSIHSDPKKGRSSKELKALSRMHRRSIRSMLSCKPGKERALQNQK